MTHAAHYLMTHAWAFHATYSALVAGRTYLLTYLLTCACAGGYRHAHLQTLICPPSHTAGTFMHTLTAQVANRAFMRTLEDPRFHEYCQFCQDMGKVPSADGLYLLTC